MQLDKYSNIVEDTEREYNYFIIIATHDPDESKLGSIDRSLSYFLRKEYTKVIIIASGEKNKLKYLTGILKRYRFFLHNGTLFYRYTINKGIPHKWNVGIKLAMTLGADIITLITDDTFPTDEFSTVDIKKYFTNNCRPTDLLSLPIYPSELANPHKRLFVSDIGMTFSKQLAKVLQFDEQLVHTFTDYKFSFQVATKLGKIIIYPKIIIDQVAPTYADGIAYLPEWILYLIFRNSSKRLEF